MANGYELSYRRHYFPSELEEALARQVPVATKYDKDGKQISHTWPVPMSAEEFKRTHDRPLQVDMWLQLNATNGIPAVPPHVQKVLDEHDQDIDFLWYN